MKDGARNRIAAPPIREAHTKFRLQFMTKKDIIRNGKRFNQFDLLVDCRNAQG